MCITEYSLAMGCIWTSVLTIILRMIQKGKWTWQYFGVSNLLMLYLFCIFRMTVPIEFPVTKVVSVRNVYNAVTQLCAKKVINNRIFVGHLILIIWCCGTLIRLFLLLKDYRDAKRMLCVCSLKREGLACELLEKLQSETGDKRNIKIYMTPFDVPMEMGILHHIILLPDRAYKKQSLYYVIKHEYTHILNHDAMVKLLLNLWTCIFWWNPVAYLLNVDIEDILELKCDLKAAGGLGNEEKAAYLATILEMIQNMAKKREETSYKMHDVEKIKKRFRCISECPEMTKKVKVKYKMNMAVISMVYIIVLCISYCVVFQSAFDVPIEDVMTQENVHFLEPETTYLREKEGRYEVIYQGQCISVIDEDKALLMIEDGFEIK